ncbi:MAG: bactofilin family protein [Burkholderiales bacterium]
MFNRDGLFGKKDENARPEPRTDLRTAVNVTPGLGSATPLQRAPQQPAVESPRPDLRFAEPAPKETASRSDQPTGSRLIVGPDIKLKGVEITDCDTLVVEGRVEASMDSRVVEIAEAGVFSGTVSIDVAEIRGRFEGELTARKQLVIYATGKVSGRIRYGTIRIEEGGEVSGEISTLAGAPAQVPASATGGSASTASSSIPPLSGAARGTGTQSTSAGASASDTGSPTGRPAQGKTGAGVNTV